MGLEYNLERNDLALCTACEMMINDGMTGCIKYSMGILAKLPELLGDAALAELVHRAYEVQHDLRYELTDEETIARLAQFLATRLQGYVAVRGAVLDDVVIATILDDVFFYKRPVISAIQMLMFEGADADAATRYALQFLEDVCTSYFEYLEPIELAITNR